MKDRIRNSYSADRLCRNVFASILILLLAAVDVQAQTAGAKSYTVKGQVLSLIDDLPIPNVEVFLKGTHYAAQTDTFGTFRIRGVPPGTYDVIARYPDFDATILRNIDVPPRSRREFVFNLQPKEPASPVPFVDLTTQDSLAALSGTVTVRVDTFKAHFDRGSLRLRAAEVGDMRSGFLYHTPWKILPVAEQKFRFQFYVPSGKKYRLYLIWQQDEENYIRDVIVDVAREVGKPNAARVFDLAANRKIALITVALDASRLP